MDSAPVFITVATLTRIVFPMLYALACLAVYRWFIPDLSTMARRLAGILLAAQVLAISKTLFIEPASSFEAWLWQLHGEWNVPATLAATQLAMVGSVALASAWLRKRDQLVQPLYLLGIALVFLFLAYDEYFTLHEHFAGWDYYIMLGMAVVAATMLVLVLSPRRFWKWHACLLVGLAISAAGAIEVERFGSVCGDYGLIFIVECPPSTAWALEEILEFLGIWLALVAILGQFSNVSTHSKRLRRALLVLPAVWIVILIPLAPIWPVAQQAYSQPAAAAFESGAGLHAYRIEKKSDSIAVHLYLSPEGWDFKGLGYSLHLVDQVTGESIASRHTHAHRRSDFFLAPGHVPVYRQWKRLIFPPGTPSNRAFAVLLTLWHKQGDDIVYERALSSDLKLVSEAQVVLDEFVLPADSPAPASAPLAQFENGFTLAAVDLPESVRPGENMIMLFTWRSDESGIEDHAQYLHLGHIDSGAWFVYDQDPLGPRLPTRLWYPGLADSETWQVPLPADLAPGRYRVFTGLYRARDQERVPVTAADGTPFVDARVPLGALAIER